MVNRERIDLRKKSNKYIKTEAENINENHTLFSFEKEIIRDGFSFAVKHIAKSR